MKFFVSEPYQGCPQLPARNGVKFWSAGHEVGEPPEEGRDPLGRDAPLRHCHRA